MITQIQVSQIDYIKIEQIQIVVLANVFVPGDMSIDDFALALNGSIGWLQCFKHFENEGTICYYEACTHVVSLYTRRLSGSLFQ